MSRTALSATGREPAPLPAEGVPDRFHFRKQPYRIGRLYGFLCDVLRYDTAPHLQSDGETEAADRTDCVSVSAHGLLYVLACLCRTAGRIDPQSSLKLTLGDGKEDGCLSLSVAGKAGNTMLRDAPLLATAQKVGHSGHFRFEASPDGTAPSSVSASGAMPPIPSPSIRPRRSGIRHGSRRRWH